MAKPKIVQPGKQAKMPKDFPVDRYPYVAIKPGDNPLHRPHYRSHAEAIQKLRAEVEATQDQFKHLSEDIRQNCTNIISALGKLPQGGGTIDHLLDPYTGIRYRVELVYRRAAAA